MADKRVECNDVAMPDTLRVGMFANAFRIIHDSGNEFFLDFIHFSESEGLALVVSRVRVQESFMVAIRDRLSSTMDEITFYKDPDLSGLTLTGSEDVN